MSGDLSRGAGNTVGVCVSRELVRFSSLLQNVAPSTPVSYE
jgi:hypothetical protein